jgi:hypothetical protein
MFTGMMPLDRLPIALYAAGVKSISRFEAQLPLQHERSPHHRSVCGPQSVILTPISVVPQRFLT